MKMQTLIVPVLGAAAALASGCASDTRDRGNDYQCGYAGWNEGRHGAIAGGQGRAGCGAEYAAAAAADQIITKGTP